MGSFKYMLDNGVISRDTSEGVKSYRYPLIMVKNEKGYKKAHPLSVVVRELWGGLEYNSQRIHVNRIVKFMNWLNVNKFRLGYSEITLELLELHHCNLFLSDLSTQDILQKKTVKGYEDTLIQFLNFIGSKGFLNQSMYEEIQRKLENAQYVFEIPIYNQGRNRVLHDLREEYIFSFLYLTMQEANEIALGVHYQIFGGLRRGEVVTLTRDRVNLKGPLGKYGHELEIKTEILRPDLKDLTGSAFAKTKVRTAFASPTPLLNELYEQHLNRYIDTTGRNALFVDQHGKPMSGSTYSYHFNKVKRKFIEKLINHPNTSVSAYGVHLRSVEWSTHIGRGIFSNRIASSTDNPLDVMRARGDKSIESSITYLENTERMHNNMQNLIQEMYDSRIMI